jgi:hypothetical protein
MVASAETERVEKHKGRTRTNRRRLSNEFTESSDHEDTSVLFLGRASGGLPHILLILNPPLPWKPRTLLGSS